MRKEINKLFVKFSDVNIQINLHKTEFLESRLWENKILRDKLFLLEEEPSRIDFTFDFKERESPALFIDENKFASLVAERQSPRKIDFYYTSRYPHFHWIVKNILRQLLRKTFMLHASGIARNGNAVLFLGESGAGKSTIIKLLRNDFKIIASDSVFIKDEGRYRVYQTPFVEKEKWLKKDNESFILNKIFFLRKSEYFKITRITSYVEIYKRFIASIMLPELNKKRNLDFIVNFIKSFDKFYYLYFAKNSPLHEYELFNL